MTALPEDESATEARRRAILAAAISEFAHKGYDQARVVDIAERAGMTDAGVLYHFGTKRALFSAVLAARESGFEALLATPSASVREALTRFSELVATTTSDPELIVFRVTLTAAAHLDNHPGADRARTALEKSLAVLVPLLRAGIESGELRADVDPRQSTLELLALHDGIRAHWSVLPEAIDYAATFAAAMDNFYAGIATQPRNRD